MITSSFILRNYFKIVRKHLRFCKLCATIITSTEYGPAATGLPLRVQVSSASAVHFIRFLVNCAAFIFLEVF